MGGEERKKAEEIFQRVKEMRRQFIHRRGEE
jgi:hypothetical protein